MFTETGMLQAWKKEIGRNGKPVKLSAERVNPNDEVESPAVSVRCEGGGGFALSIYAMVSCGYHTSIGQSIA